MHIWVCGELGLLLALGECIRQNMFSMSLPLLVGDAKNCDFFRVEVWCPIIPFIDMDVLEGNPIYLLT
jgi:hypothetical protein